MKKIITILAVVATTMFASCTTDEVTTETSKPQTTSVAFLLDQSNSNLTSKQVQRGDVPASVSRIDIKASLVGDTYFKTEQFDLVANDPNSNIEKNFILTDVGIGSNVFTATTQTTATQYYTLAPSSGTAEAKITELKAHVPYVLYSGTKTQTIAVSNNIVNMDMTTPNGRLLAVFQLENDSTFKAGYEATITAKADGEVIAGTTKVQQSGIVYFEFSNTKSLGGKKVTYTVDVTPINNNNNLHTIYTIEQVVKASTSISCIYTISKDKSPSKTTSENKIVFSFQKWVEETCETCK